MLNQEAREKEDGREMLVLQSLTVFLLQSDGNQAEFALFSILYNSPYFWEDCKEQDTSCNKTDLFKILCHSEVILGS